MVCKLCLASGTQPIPGLGLKSVKVNIDEVYVCFCSENWNGSGLGAPPPSFLLFPGILQRYLFYITGGLFVEETRFLPVFVMCLADEPLVMAGRLRRYKLASLGVFGPPSSTWIFSSRA